MAKCICYISVILSSMRSALSVAFAVIVLSVLSTPATAAGGAGVLDEVALQHEMKVTYCLEQRGKRFHRTENLDDLCTLKVAFFDDLVSLKYFSQLCFYL